MWDYSEEVKEHFFNPRNAGAVEDANGLGEVGSISCGDALRLTLKVDPDTDVILDAGFQTFGCGSAIASSSALTEMVKGRTVDQALLITNQEIADFLGGLPPEKMHCSVMGREALHAAVANYRGEVWEDDHEEGELICKCFGIEKPMVENTIRANGLTSIEEVINYTKAGGGCSTCHEKIEEILVAVMGELDFKPASKIVIEPAKPAVVGKKKFTNLQRIRVIEETIEKLRPALQADKGDIELVEVDGSTIYVNLTGAGPGCQMAAMTLGGVQQKLIESLGEFVRLVPASEMAKA